MKYETLSPDLSNIVSPQKWMALKTDGFVTLQLKFHKSNITGSNHILH